MASYPAEGREIMLNVRIATPPFDRAKNGWMSVNRELLPHIFFQEVGDKALFQVLLKFLSMKQKLKCFILEEQEWLRCDHPLYHLFKTLKTNEK